MNAVAIDEFASAQHAASAFLRTVFAGHESGNLALFFISGESSLFTPIAKPTWHQDAAAAAIRARDTTNVYFGVGLHGTIPSKGRGKEANVVALPGLWADIDILGPNHKSQSLPPTLEDAYTILDSFPFKPSIILHTGGGLQAFWLFREPLETSNDADRRSAKRLSKGFHKYLASIAATYGWSIDTSVADLARVLRVPGTYNRKQSTPHLVTCEVLDGNRRFNPSEFEEFIQIEADPELKAHVQGAAPEHPRADFRLVRSSCGWMQHCIDDADSLTEPEWYRALAIVGRCIDGREFAHEISKPYPKYSAEETDKKFTQALGASGPATCNFIANDLGQGHHCGRCPHRGKVKSPVVLGLPKRRRTTPAPSTPSAPPSQPSAAAPADLQPVRPRRQRRPNIQATDRQLRDVTRDSLNALQTANDPPEIFIRIGKPAVVTRLETGRFVIAEGTDRVLRNRLTKAADFYEVTNLGVRNCPPPMHVVQDILALPPLDWELPPLEAVTESPALRVDGTILSQPGYDAASRLFFAPDENLELPEIPDVPMIDHVEAAIDTILDILADFPFVDDASRANAVALMLTPICRPAISGPTPLALVDATTQGSGKTLLTEIVSLIATSREGALFSAPREPEEWRKQLTSNLREGSTMMIIDNVNYRLDAGELCKALTAVTYGDRILGQSTNVTLPVRCTWVATGNNISLGGDMPRRCYWIRMDPKTSKPFQRTGFRHKNLKKHVANHRGGLLASLLTLARYWFLAGCPEPSVTPVGSFEEWTRIIGGILQLAGIQGFLGNSDNLYETADIESVQWEAFLSVLHASFYGEEFTVAQVWEKLHDKTWSDATRQIVLTEKAEELRAALPDFIAQAMDREGFFKQRLGTAFGERRGRRFGESQAYLDRGIADTHGKVARWKVVLNAA